MYFGGEAISRRLCILYINHEIASSGCAFLAMTEKSRNGGAKGRIQDMNIKNYFALILMIIILLSACASTSDTSYSRTTPTRLSTATLTSTSHPTQLSSTTPTVVLTPLPTLLPEDAQELVLKLLETNGDCQLPCWWGWIIPGKTKWEDVNRFLQTFATNVRLNGEKNGLQLWSAYFKVPDTVQLSEELIASIDVQNGIVEQLLVGQLYTLTDLLQENGKPNDVLLEISDDTFEEFSPWGRFTLVLFWREKGILAVYQGRIEKTELLNLCMNKIDKTAPSFWLWDPLKEKTMEEVGGELLFGTPPFLPEFYSLQEVIGIDVEAFYQTYSAPNNINICFQILASFSP